MAGSTAVTRLVKHQFVSDSGEIIPYERLALIGSINGETLTLEIKLNNSELQLARAILSSTEDLNVAAAKTSADDELEFLKQQKAEGNFLDD